MAFVIIPDILEQARDWHTFFTGEIVAKNKSLKYTYIVQEVRPTVCGCKFQLTGTQGSFIILELMCSNQDLAKWKGENVLSLYILTAVELEGSALNLLPGIKKQHFSLKVVNIQGTLTEIFKKPNRGMNPKP